MKYSRLNTLLLIGIILINGVIFMTPFLPAFLFKAELHDTARQHRLQRTLQAPVVHEANSLIMPTIGFSQPVFDGPTLTTLRKGIWRRPATSTPDRDGNTVFAAHRFTYSNPRGTFYNLDKLHVGDPIGVIWNQKMYRYTVSSTKVVGPNDTAIEAPTAQPQLTLYTCTPLTLPKDRLVVVATPETTTR